ncbi:MAG: T9SS type A sorting domain-containing protein [Bacteroidales bacterium]|nr:T9SS type A sorting domain-containing protein [Bacteroidales bacterium]
MKKLFLSLIVLAGCSSLLSAQNSFFSAEMLMRSINQTFLLTTSGLELLGIENPTDNLSVTVTESENGLSITSNQPMTLVQLFDINGKMLRQYEPNSTLCFCEWSNFPAGIYILTVNFKDSVYSKRIVKRSKPKE